MTNEEKAHRICETITSIYGVDIAQEAHIFSAILEAMQWKDEQHEQEKQQWIEKACEWLADKRADTFFVDSFTFLLGDFKKSMK